MSPTPTPLCKGIQWHQDTQWQRCPKASSCLRYIRRMDDREHAVDRLCNTVEFEHYMEAPNAT